MDLKKEALIFFSIFLSLSLFVHFDAWMSYPLAHIQALSKSSLGVFHPLFLTLFVYLIVGVLRFIFNFSLRLFKSQ